MLYIGSVNTLHYRWAVTVHVFYHGIDSFASDIIAKTDHVVAEHVQQGILHVVLYVFEASVAYVMLRVVA